jgi:cytochrome oxidase Cu insertion factor (SCO1/SenC/PrrC family)
MSKRKQHLTIIVLIIIFFGPVLFAWTTYVLQPKFLQQRTNKGTLILPPANFNALQLYSAQGDILQPQQLQHKWLLLLVTPLPCQQACQENLFKLRQLQRTFLQKDQARMQPVVAVFAKATDKNFLPLLKKEYSIFTLVYLHVQNFDTVFAKVAAREPAQGTGAIFIVDPNGNIIMSYDLSAKPKSIQKDLQKLLKASNIG